MERIVREAQYLVLDHVQSNDFKHILFIYFHKEIDIGYIKINVITILLGSELFVFHFVKPFFPRAIPTQPLENPIRPNQ